MRPNITQEIRDALAAQGITTAYMARLDFASGTVCAWTGAHSIEVQSSADSLLNGQTFHPIQAGIMVQIGDNSFSYSGSESLDIHLACRHRSRLKLRRHRSFLPNIRDGLLPCGGRC